MEYLEPTPFLDAWHNTMIVGAIISVIAGVMVFVGHSLKVASIRDYHRKYDYLNKNEIRNYKIMFACFGLAAMMAVNLYGMATVHEMGIWFYVRLFMSFAGGTLIGYISYLVLEYYYPTRLDKKLKYWRYHPRKNPKTGNIMRMLSEEEEDVHLDEGMKAEEGVFSNDYDVWIDEKTGDVQIEKYPGRLQALKCNTCGFYTMRIVKEEITKMPDEAGPGELVKHYQCSYCKSVRATAFRISNKEADDYKKQKFKFRRNKEIDLVKVEIHSISGGKKHYEFQNLEEARRFMAEYDPD